MSMDADRQVHRHLYDLEERLLRPEIRHSSKDVANLLDDQFIEYGSSGEIHDKRSIIEELASEKSVPMSIAEFRTTSLGEGLVLATYRAVAVLPDGGEKHSLRSSIWRSTDGSWRMIFHQGTPIVSRTS